MKIRGAIDDEVACCSEKTRLELHMVDEKLERVLCGSRSRAAAGGLPIVLWQTLNGAENFGRQALKIVHLWVSTYSESGCELYSQVPACVLGGGRYG